MTEHIWETILGAVRHTVPFALTCAAGFVGAGLYVLQQQRLQHPDHRPLSRHGWRYTVLAVSIIAAVVTAGSYFVPFASEVVAPSVLAFTAPVGVGAAKTVASRAAGTNGSAVTSHARQWLTFGLAYVVDWLNFKLEDHLDLVVHDWAKMEWEPNQIELLVQRLERRVARNATRTRQLKEYSAKYLEARLRWDASHDPAEKRRLWVDLEVATEGILRFAYGVRAEILVNGLDTLTQGSNN